jgi:hypothetical protein
MLDNWKSRGIAAAVVVLLLVSAFVAGRFSAPEQVRTQTVEQVVYKDRVIEKRVEVAVAAKVETKIVYRDRVIKVGGEIVEHEVERTGAVTSETKTSDSARAAESSTERVRVETKVVTVRPDWRIEILAGASVQKPWLPIAGPLVLGAQAERRIVGGLWAGVWAQTGGAAGASLSFEF